VGVAVAEVVSKYCSGRVTLKWPNDVLVEGKKICGILSEMRTKGQEIDFVVIGIGININIDKKDFNEEFRNTSTSLKEENSAEISRTDFAAGLCRSLEKWYNRFITLGFPPVRDKWMEYSGLLGKYIEVKNRDEVQRGRVIEIDERGALVLCDDKKETSHVLTGDVFLI
jgi:BirA family biotin operon repressor/biotin-[acetyl-CoA-carboxylase] ligase